MWSAISTSRATDGPGRVVILAECRHLAQVVRYVIKNETLQIISAATLGREECGTEPSEVPSSGILREGVGEGNTMIARHCVHTRSRCRVPDLLGRHAGRLSFSSFSAAAPVENSEFKTVNGSPASMGHHPDHRRRTGLQHLHQSITMPSGVRHSHGSSCIRINKEPGH